MVEESRSCGIQGCQSVTAARLILSQTEAGLTSEKNKRRGLLARSGRMAETVTIHALMEVMDRAAARTDVNWPPRQQDRQNARNQSMLCDKDGDAALAMDTADDDPVLSVLFS